MSTIVLKEYRARHKISQAKLGEQIGVQDAAICKWEKGKVPSERVLALSEITGIPPHALRPDLYRAPDLPAREVNSDV